MKAMKWAALAAISFIVGCVSAPSPTTLGSAPAYASATSWRYSADVDRISGKTKPSLSLAPTTARYNGRTGFGSAAVICGEGKPSVMFVFDWPVGATHNSIVGYRFDQKPGREPAVEFFNTKAPVINGAADAKTFLADAKNSSSLYVRVSSPVGVSEIEFNTAGGNAAISQFEQSCLGA